MAEKQVITSTIPSLVGGKLFLRPAAAEDIANTYHWRLMEEPQKYCEYPLPYMRASEAAEAYKKAEKSADSQDFGICTIKEKTLVGLISFTDLNSLNRSARMEMLIDPDEKKKEHGPEAIRILCNHLFRYRGLNKVYAHVSEFDDDMVRDLTKVGFKRDGTLRRHLFYKGEFHDMFIYSLLLFDFDA